MTYIPWGDHRGGRLELSLLDCAAPHSDLAADPPRNGEGCLLFDGGDFHLPLHKLGEFTATLYEAAGLGVPIVLDQVPDRTFAEWMEIRERMVWLDVRGPLPFESARRFAATLVAEVERAEKKLDPAAVEVLAEVILADERTFGGRADKWADRAARAVLDRYTLTERTASDG